MLNLLKGHRLRKVAVAVLLGGLVAAGAVAGPAAAEPTERRSYHGFIDGAEYRVELPDDWNGTLVLFSHGYYIKDLFDPEGVQLANRPETERWLLDHGYALAASDYRNPYRYAVADAQRDQIALLDWFEANVGRPDRTVTSGMSQGGVISTVLAERNPRRFDGVATNCAEYDTPGTWNTGLDITFAIKTLLAPGESIDLVKASDPELSAQRLGAAAARAMETPEGRARLSLIGALANMPAWFSAHDPEPTALADRLQQQAVWTSSYTSELGPIGRADLENRVGGNPSWNVGVDYRRQFERSGFKSLALQAYAAAGLTRGDLERDLRTLNRAPRIAAEPAAVAFMLRHGTSRGYTPAPVITMHNTGDGGALVDQEGWYGTQVSRNGDPRKLRQLYVGRGMHCAFSSGDEIVLLQTLFSRVETGRWPSTSPSALNARVRALGPEYQLVLDIVTGQDKAAAPAFTQFTPPTFLRPTL